MADETKALTAPLLPDHYCKAIRNLLYASQVACVLGIWGGLMGTELRMRLGYDQVPPGPHLEATIYLSLLHGHLFAIGGFLPMCMCAMLVFSRQIGAKPISKKFLPKVVFLYIVGGVLSVALLLVRGIQTAAMAQTERDFSVIESKILYSNILRLSVYLISHVTITAGICIFMFLVGYSLRTTIGG